MRCQNRDRTDTLVVHLIRQCVACFTPQLLPANDHHKGEHEGVRHPGQRFVSIDQNFLPRTRGQSLPRLHALSPLLPRAPFSVLQDCLLFEPPEEQQDAEVWYCADFCGPDNCPSEGEVCELLPTPCADSSAPCPPEAVCQQQCDPECDENQVSTAE